MSQEQEYAEKVEYFQKMREDGATSEQVFTMAEGEQGFNIIDIKAMRAVFDLSWEEAKSFIELHSTPFKTPEDVVAFLKEELGLCQCAGLEPILLLRDVLRLIQDRKGEQFAAKKSALEALLGAKENWSLSVSYLFFLEVKGLVYHGFNEKRGSPADLSAWMDERL